MIFTNGSHFPNVSILGKCCTEWTTISSIFCVSPSAPKDLDDAPKPGRIRPLLLVTNHITILGQDLRVVFEAMMSSHIGTFFSPRPKANL